MGAVQKSCSLTIQIQFYEFLMERLLYFGFVEKIGPLLTTEHAWAGVFPLCYYPYLHAGGRPGRQSGRPLDIKQEPGEPGEPGPGPGPGPGWGQHRETSDCLYQENQKQTRLKNEVKR